MADSRDDWTGKFGRSGKHDKTTADFTFRAGYVVGFFLRQQTALSESPFDL
jgi:hypothetical protein